MLILSSSAVSPVTIKFAQWQYLATKDVISSRLHHRYNGLEQTYGLLNGNNHDGSEQTYDLLNGNNHDGSGRNMHYRFH